MSALADKLNKGLAATKKTVRNYTEAIMCRMMKDMQHRAEEAQRATEVELTKERVALFTALDKCEEHLQALREAQGTGHYKKIDPCHTYKLLEFASMAHRLVAKIEVIQTQLERHNTTLNLKRNDQGFLEHKEQ